MDSSSYKEPEKCRLLALPPELRNQIYRLAILEPQPITIQQSGYDRSSLLSTCKQTHHEALKIFYLENTFKISIRDHDSKVLQRWVRHVSAEIDVPEIAVLTNTELEAVANEPNWENLVGWLKAFHCLDLKHGMKSPQDLGAHSRQDIEMVLLSTIFSQVFYLRRQPWQVVAPIVEVTRAALVLQDQRWGQN